MNRGADHFWLEMLLEMLVGRLIVDGLYLSTMVVGLFNGVGNKLLGGGSSGLPRNGDNRPLKYQNPNHMLQD
jgi:hypothetical protein